MASLIWGILFKIPINKVISLKQNFVARLTTCISEYNMTLISTLLYPHLLPIGGKHPVTVRWKMQKCARWMGLILANGQLMQCGIQSKRDVI